VRYNHGGKLYTLVYDKLVAREVNPIEKKPLFHFHPGSFAYSISTVGCSLRCSFCQNWYISQWPKDHLPKHIDRMQDRPPTGIALLRRAREIGLAEGLRYVYQGNVPGEEGENTYCYACKTLLIKRFGFSVLQNRIREDGCCPDCGNRIDGIGMSGPLIGGGIGNNACLDHQRRPF
jgi:hypothetical protein